MKRWILTAAAAAAALAFGGIWLGDPTSSARAKGQRRDAHLHEVLATRATGAGADRRVVARLPSPRVITGRVLSTDGEALAGATVCTVGDSETCCALAQCSRSDETGHFALEAVGADVGAVVASAADHLPRRQALRSGEESERGLRIALAPGGAEVEGRVVDASGGALPFAQVMLHSPGAASALAVTASDLDGRFRVHVAPGAVHVTAQAEAYAQAIRTVHAPARGVIFALGSSAGITGRVLRADNAEPVAGVTVTARALASEPASLTVAQSEQDGRFHVRGLTGPALYEVFAQASEWRSAPESVSIDMAQTSDAVVLRVLPATTLTGSVESDGEGCAGATVNLSGPVNSSVRADQDGQVTLSGLLPGSYQVNIYCPHALPFSQALELGRQPLTQRWSLARGLAVRGRVESPRGEPVANAVVNVMSVGEGSELSSTHCATAADGTFSCFGLAPGTYECSVDDAGDPTRDVVRTLVSEGSSPDILLRTRPAGTLRVALAPSPTGEQRVPRVFARGPSGVPVEATRAQNGFVLTGMPLGEYEVYVELPTANGQPARAQLTHDGQVVELALAAPPPLSIQGRAVDGHGTPWVDAWVNVVPSDPLARPSSATEPPALTDERGEFSIDGLAPGAYDVHIFNGSGQSQLRSVPAGSHGVQVLIANAR